jgi:hypothetical protein
MATGPTRPNRKGAGQRKTKQTPPDPDSQASEGDFFSSETSETSGYKRPPDEDVIEAFHQARGNLCLAARRIGVSDRQVRRWVSASPPLKQALIDARDHAEEWAVSKLLELIDGVYKESKKGTVYKSSPNILALMFYLKCQHGWTDKDQGDKDDTAAQVVRGLADLVKDASRRYDPSA